MTMVTHSRIMLQEQNEYHYISPGRALSFLDAGPEAYSNIVLVLSIEPVSRYRSPITRNDTAHVTRPPPCGAVIRECMMWTYISWILVLMKFTC